MVFRGIARRWLKWLRLALGTSARPARSFVASLQCEERRASVCRPGAGDELFAMDNGRPQSTALGQKATFWELWPDVRSSPVSDRNCDLPARR
jgi:hypothetical protein